MYKRFCLTLTVLLISPGDCAFVLFYFKSWLNRLDSPIISPVVYRGCGDILISFEGVLVKLRRLLEKNLEDYYDGLLLIISL